MLEFEFHAGYFDPFGINDIACRNCISLLDFLFLLLNHCYSMLDMLFQHGMIIFFLNHAGKSEFLAGVPIPASQFFIGMDGEETRQRSIGGGGEGGGSI